MPIQGIFLRFIAAIPLLLVACHAPVSSTIESPPARILDGTKTKLVVFVHGYTGDEDTWTKFTNLVQDDEAMRDFETYSFDYPTQMIPGWNNRSIRQIGDLLTTQLTERFAKYKEIYLIGHSMGGLVICSTVIEQLKAGRAHNLKPIKHIILFGTPNNGAQIPKLFRFFDKQLEDLSATEQTVDEIRNEWINRVYNPKIAPGDANYKLAIPVTVVIGLEDDIVDERSARSFFREPSPVMVPGTHRSMKEPANHDSVAYVIVKNRLLTGQSSAKEVMPGAPVAMPSLLSLFMTDFVGKGSGGGVSLIVNGYGDLTFRDRGAFRFFYKVIQDFGSRSKFMSIYIPSSHHAYEAIEFLATGYKQYIDSLQADSGSAHSPAVTRSEELVFTGRVFIYCEDTFTLSQLGKLSERYEKEKLSPEFLTTSYAFAVWEGIRSGNVKPPPKYELRDGIPQRMERN